MAYQLKVFSEEEVNQIGSDYGDVLNDVFVGVEVRLFGSYMKKTANPNSDLDLAIVSRDFKGMDTYTAMKILQRLKRKVNAAIEPIPFTPQDLSQPDLGSLAYDVAQQNVLLYKA